MQNYSVSDRLVWELRGWSCLPLELQPKPKKSTCVSRSFGQPIMELAQLKEAIACYTSKAAYKLRRQQQAATALQVFARTSPYDENSYTNLIKLKPAYATNYTPILIQYACAGIEEIFLPGYRYKKAGVIMLGLIPENVVQGHLLVEPPNEEYQQCLMATLDGINQQYEPETLRFAASGLERPWWRKSQRRSPRYTTKWDELPIVKAGWFKK